MAKSETDKKALKNKDFPLAFLTLEAIDSAEGLTPDEQLREKVKHLSMQMFGLAVDLANQNKKYNEFGKRIDEKNKVISHLQSLLVQRNAYIQKYCVGLKTLRGEVKRLKAELSQYQGTAKPKPIKDLTSEERQAVQADYYEKRIASLKTQVQTRNEQIAKLKARLALYEDSPK